MLRPRLMRACKLRHQKKKKKVIKKKRVRGRAARKRMRPAKRAKSLEVNHRVHHHKTIHFDPRGLDAPVYNSNAHSKSHAYCNMTHRNIIGLGHTMGITYQLEKAVDNRGKKSLCEVLNDFFPVRCLKGWRITNFLGAGSFGYVFSTRNSKNERGALKIVRDEANFSVDKEIVMQKKYHKLGLSPGIIDHCSYLPKGGDRIHFIIMERIDGVIDDFLQKKSHHKLLETLMDRLFQIIKKMHVNKITHGDFHSENIGFLYRRGDNPGTIQVIDHGMSTDKGSSPELELVQFMRTIEPRYSPKMNSDNRKFIKTRAHYMAKKMFNITLPKTLAGLENKFVTLRRKLYRERE